MKVQSTSQTNTVKKMKGTPLSDVSVGDSDDEAPTLVELGDADASETPLPPAAGQKDPPSSTSNIPPCPVTILSGFLGSGKTTLIQYILKSPDHGKRIAVIENEFGDGLSVESLIARDGVNDASLTDLIELPNGCICCTVKDSLVATLENLLEKRRDLDYILIECSGMANPGPIAALFWLDDALGSRLQLDGIVTLVDAKNITRQLSTTEEAAQQVAYADRILLNKVDLVADAEAALTARLRRINPTAPIRPTQFSVVPDLDWILEARCFDPDRLATPVDDNGDDGHCHHHHHEHSHDEDNCAVCNSPEHRHTEAVSSLSLVETGGVDLERVHRWLASILWPDQDESNQVLNNALLHHESSTSPPPPDCRIATAPQIFRIKGILAATTAKDARRYIVQAVHDLWEIHPASDSLRWKPHEVKRCTMVVIGRNLPEQELRDGFRACLL